MTKWDKIKTFVPIVAQAADLARENKLITLKTKDYSTPESLTKWLNLAQEIITENERETNELLQLYHTNLNMVKVLLKEANKDSEVKSFLNKLETKKAQAQHYLDENEFLFVELANLQQRKIKNFTDEHLKDNEITVQLEQTLVDNDQLLQNLYATLTSLENNHSQVETEEKAIKNSLRDVLSAETLNEITINELRVKNDYLTTRNKRLGNREAKLIAEKLITEEALQAQAGKLVHHDSNLADEEETKRQSLIKDKLIKDLQAKLRQKEEAEAIVNLPDNERRRTFEEKRKSVVEGVANLQTKLSEKDKYSKSLEKKLADLKSQPATNGLLTSNKEDTHDYLTRLKTRWENHCNSSLLIESYANNKNNDYLSSLLSLVEQALATNTKEGYQQLVTEWTTTCPDWSDGAHWELGWLKARCDNWEDKVSSKSSLSNEEKKELEDKLINLELELGSSKNKLEKTQTASQKGSEQIKQLITQNEKEVESVKKAVKAKYKSYIKPNDTVKIEEKAKELLGMKTKEEVQIEVETKVQEVKQVLEQEKAELQTTLNTVTEEKEQLQQEKEQLVQEKEEVTTNLTEWKDAFTDYNSGEEAKQAFDKNYEERQTFYRNFRQEQMDKEDYKEEAEKFKADNDDFMNIFGDLRVKYNKAYTTIGRLENLLTQANIDPNEGKGSDEEVSDDENDEGGEEAPSTTSEKENVEDLVDEDSQSEKEEQQETTSVKSTSPTPSSPKEGNILSEKENLSEEEKQTWLEEFNEEELIEEEKQKLEEIKKDKDMVKKIEDRIANKTGEVISDPQYYVQMGESKADLEKKIETKIEKLRELIAQRKEQLTAQQIINN